MFVLIYFQVLPSITHISSLLKFKSVSDYKSSRVPISFSHLKESNSNNSSLARAVESISSLFNSEQSQIIIEKLFNSLLNAKSGKVKTEIVAKILSTNDSQSILPIKILYNAKKETLRLNGTSLCLHASNFSTIAHCSCVLRRLQL